MASDKEKQSLLRRTEAVGRLPAPKLELSPLPPEVLKAFPALKEWHSENNKRIAEWLSKTNTALTTIT